MNSKAAGIHFIEGDKIILGKKVYGKLKNKWSGFGGSVERGETTKRAAIREILEEFYGLENIDPNIIKDIEKSIDLVKAHQDEHYTLYIADFSTLSALNKKVSTLFHSTPFFGPRIPVTVNGMIKKYDSSSSRNPEIRQIDLFRFSEILSKPRDFDPYVIEDIERIYNH